MIGILDKLKFDDILGYFAAGTTKRTSSIIDMANFDGVVFVCNLGTLLDTGTLDCFVEQHTLNQASGMARVASTTVFTCTPTEAALTQSSILVNIYRPTKRYLQCNITPAVANAVVRGITAIRYAARVQAVLQVAAGTLKATTLTSPAEGT